MGATNSSNKSKKYYSLKAKASATETPHFALNEKVGDKWQNTASFDTMSGMLIGAEIKEKDIKGVKQNFFILTFDDGTEVSQLDMGHNSISHGIISCLCGGFDTISTYSINLSKKDAGNGVYFGSGWVKENGNDKKWPFHPTKDAPPKEPVYVNGQPFMQNGKHVKDDSKLKAFYEQKFRECIVSKFGGIKETIINNTASTDAVTDVDPLPF